MGEILNAGIQISLPDINSADFSFKPDVKNNRILYGLKAMLNVGDDLVEQIIANRPYVSIKDFYNRVKPKKQSMISLIKGGAFDELMNRNEAMVWYIWTVCDKKKRITLQNMLGLIKYDLIPQDTEDFVTAKRIFEFNRYLKACCKVKNYPNYLLDDRAIEFLTELNYENMFYVLGTKYEINIDEWDKIYQSWMDIFRNWIAENKEEILDSLNTTIFMEEWNKYAKGNYSSWEMNALCFYYHDHELKNINKERYGIKDFSELPQNPVVDKTYMIRGKEVKIFKLDKICGTCIAKNKTKSTVSLLTSDGVVNVKFRKEYFSLFDKRISERGADGVKHIVEKSWFDRGSMIVVNGMRTGDDFLVKKYNKTAGHQLYKINKVYENGEIELTSERYKGESDE